MSPLTCTLRSFRRFLAAIACPASYFVWIYLAACTPLHAQCGPRAGDAFWEVSSRLLPDCVSPLATPNFRVHRVDGGYWNVSEVATLVAELQARPAGRVVVYVHGNWMPQSAARQRALRVYQRLIETAGCEPICFIAFSWPSERREGFARDVIAKKSRLDADAFYLAQLLSQFPGQLPCGLVGYSFGGAVTCGALHLLQGGALCGLTVDPPPQLPWSTVRVSLIAPAFDRAELTAHGRYALAMEEVDKLVNLYNSSDPVLKRFRFFDRHSSPTAAGFAGILEPRALSPLASNPKIVQFDCRSVGRTHAELSYLDCPSVQLSFANVMGQ